MYGPLHAMNYVQPGWTPGIPGMVESLAVGAFCVYFLPFFVFLETLCSVVSLAAYTADADVWASACMVTKFLALVATSGTRSVGGRFVGPPRCQIYSFWDGSQKSH